MENAKTSTGVIAKIENVKGNFHMNLFDGAKGVVCGELLKNTTYNPEKVTIDFNSGDVKLNSSVKYTLK